MTPLVIGVATGKIEYGSYAALGALPAGFVSFRGVSRTRLAGRHLPLRRHGGLDLRRRDCRGQAAVAAGPGGIRRGPTRPACCASLGSDRSRRVPAVAGRAADRQRATARARHRRQCGPAWCWPAACGSACWSSRPGRLTGAARSARRWPPPTSPWPVTPPMWPQGRQGPPSPRQLTGSYVLRDPNPLMRTAPRQHMLDLAEEAERIRATLTRLSVGRAVPPGQGLAGAASSPRTAHVPDRARGRARRRCLAQRADHLAGRAGARWTASRRRSGTGWQWAGASRYSASCAARAGLPSD